MKVIVRYRGSSGLPVVGTLANDARGRVFFEYDADWRVGGMELSPIYLPLQTAGTVTTGDPGFSPLFGLFDDSLPDWWGQRVMRKHFEEMNLPWNEVGPLEKLACQGAYALGALAYEPDLSPGSYRETIVTEVAGLVDSARDLLAGTGEKVIPALIRGGLSPGGAQPKALLAFDEDFQEVRAGGGEIAEGFSRWLMKFQIDPEDHLCQQEYAIAQMAEAAGIRVPETRLYEAADGGVHFMIRRFDFDRNGPLHMHSYGGLTHTPVRELIDYSDVMDLTRDLTGRETELEEMFRRAVFNIAIANDDDHSRNHSYLMDQGGEWKLSPAYDMTRSGYALGSGYRAAGVSGKFSKIGLKDLQKLGKDQGLRRVDDLTSSVLDAVGRWPDFAAGAGLQRAETGMLGDEFPGLRW
ncbi:type II toxin-antitoxin system HipA family toxin [Luteolibacter sp. AS25]|uniref:type II toxin-antitoxin system HipA family toxin n=1 Tax=Luteolibacter sp. AS25 TaxID=3135776 RepID=UPI00398B3F21